MKNKGGRPNYWHDILKRFIPAATHHLGKARVSDLVKMLKKDIKKDIDKHTMKKYCEILVAEGVLNREVEISNHEKFKKGEKQIPWEMVWYKLH